MDIERFGDRDILLTFQEAAAMLRVSRATMYRLIAARQLTGHKVGRSWRFYKTEVHNFVLNQHENLVNVDDTLTPHIGGPGYATGN